MESINLKVERLETDDKIKLYKAGVNAPMTTMNTIDINKIQKLYQKKFYDWAKDNKDTIQQINAAFDETKKLNG